MSELREGWLRKKGHQLGYWKWRYFRCEAGLLQYWASPQCYRQGRSPKGVLALRCFHASPAGNDRSRSRPTCLSTGPGSRLVLRNADASYDEELMATSPKDRDSWILFLNQASLRERTAASSSPVSIERFLKAKGLWDPLLRHVGCLSGATSFNQPGADGVDAEGACSLAATCQGSAPDANAASQALLSRALLGPALLRISDQTASPRQGPLVLAGRKLCARRRHAVAVSDRWVLLLSSRSLQAEGRWSGWHSPCGDRDAEPQVSLAKFEALHAFSDPLDSTEAMAALSLSRCRVGAVERCVDGSGWRIRIVQGGAAAAETQEVDGPSGGISAGSTMRDSAGDTMRDSAGDTMKSADEEEASWTLILNTQEQCEEWRRAVELACLAAQAQEAGRRRTRAEALAEYDADPAAWRCGVERRLAEAEASATGARPAAGLRLVVKACDEAWCDSEDLLDGALQQRPWHREACEAVLEAALQATVACAGRAWDRWSGSLSQNDGRDLLRWLHERRQTAHRLGVVYMPLSRAIAGLSAELGLRTGEHLRRAAAALLAKELCSATLLRQAQAGRQGPSTLPVDLFTMVFSCLPEGHGEEAVELRASSKRVARFIVYEVQEALWRWLQETLPSAAEDVLCRRAFRRQPQQQRQQPLPPCAGAWLARLAALAAAMPGFLAQCRKLNFSLVDTECHSVAGHSPTYHSTPTWTLGHEADDGLGPEALPGEWSLEVEAKRFEALDDALLWSACDIATLEWRRRAMAETAKNDLGSLQEFLVDPVELLLGLLAQNSCERVLHKMFHICLAVLILRLSRRHGQEAAKEAAQVQEATHLCMLFQGFVQKATENTCQMSWKASEAPAAPAQLPGGIAAAGQVPWELPRVQQVLHIVSETLGTPSSSGSRPGSRIASGRSTPAHGPTPSVTPRVNGPDTYGLGRLVAALRPERTLPLSELRAWFGQAAPLQTQFDELPAELPFGGAFLPARAAEARTPPQTPPQGPVVDSRSPAITARWPSKSSAGSRRLSSRLSLPGRASPDSRRASQASGAPLLEAAAAPSSSSGAPRRCRASLASEGELCELRVEDAGAYGAFCSLTVRGDAPADAEENDPGSPGSPSSEPRWRRRWAQLSRAGPRRSASFEVLDSRPEDVEGGSKLALVSHPLTMLNKATILGTTELELAFTGIGANPRALGQSFSARPDADLRRYVVRFDCPSHLFRWRLVLQAWSPCGPLREERPVVALSGAPWPDEAAASGFPQQLLTRRVLQERLGGLWAELRPRLEKAARASGE